METIYKYKLKEAPIQSLKMPMGAEILSAQHQVDDLFIWALVNDEAKLEERFFEVFGTGFEIPTDIGISRKHIDTVQQGIFVWHVFERLTNQSKN